MPRFRDVIRAWGRAVRSTASWTTSSLGIGGYNATDPRRKVLQSSRKPGTFTANELSAGGLTSLRAYARHLERNHPTARAAADGLVALVVGTGITLEPDLGDDNRNARVRSVWQDWCRNATVDGRDINQLLTQGFREVVVPGELLWRYVTLPEKKGKIKTAILPLESEWFDDSATAITGIDPNGNVKIGPITKDKYGRPIKYDIVNPDKNLAIKVEPVPAAEIIHVFEPRRSMQSRGESWFAPIIETMQQERDLVDAELKTAVNCSSLGVAITSEYHDGIDTDEEGTSDDPASSLRIGGIARLFPGEKVETLKLDRPSQQIAPFRQMLRGDIAAATRIPQRFLDRDVSQANYSSMRSDMLDQERLLGPVREWYGHATIGRIFTDLLPQLCAVAGVEMPTEQIAYRLIPDEQPYVDPVKDINAAITAISAGLSNFEIEIGKRGGERRQIWEQLARERKEAVASGIVLGLSGTNIPTPISAVGTQESDKDEEDSVEDDESSDDNSEEQQSNK